MDDVLVAASYAGVDVSDVVHPSMTPFLAAPSSAAMDLEDGEIEDGEVAEMEVDVKDMAIETAPATTAPNEAAASSSSSSEDESMAEESEPDSDDEDTGKLRDEIEAALKRDEQSSLVAEPVTTAHEIKQLPIKKPEVELTPDFPVDRMGVVLTINRAGASVTIQAQPHQAILDEGSVLCLSNRVVLGCVDEVFGPVKMPLYLIRFESADDIPATAVVSAPVFYAAQHAKYVETSKLNTKGSDASNLYDEEVGVGEADYSDDEMEAEANRKKKAAKRKLNPEAPQRAPTQGGRGPPRHGPPHYPPRGMHPHHPPHGHHPPFMPPQYPPHYQHGPPPGYFGQPPHPGYGYPPPGEGYPGPHHQPPPHHMHHPEHNHPPPHHMPHPEHRPQYPPPGQPWPPQHPYYPPGYPPMPPQDNHHYRN
ncbi:H/ACA ribonucleoprotein complex non-core subunit NAF1 [Achlya hypogyna]|uniref:H/ACA ribonucleoprotein complex non-core subunit NAF1 n=1 Tax=Achlya hypogyna TaxID=1202772 RepID=A0A1V9ZL36_ACHHY|nr:H/ACA ribonucleoprotein complex non-core subunit NAF1 [Achlya hypogyna]